MKILLGIVLIILYSVSACKSSDCLTITYLIATFFIFFFLAVMNILFFFNYWLSFVVACAAYPLIFLNFKTCRQTHS